ncbi:Plasmodium vivax Vir protein, putative [Plasmodium vivax]|uniref:Vir protein, putative n=1 Tax=Plasmodium vivax TaxID=5855 RepID=A0A1G4ECN6_PLAVI|nr:Plasmodium vivax Vir protein, putative [Plasmodium vivax]
MNKYKPFCIKLLKNIGYASEVTNDNDMSPNVRCSNLNKWLYYYTKTNHVPKEFIIKVFNIIDYLKGIFPEYIKCKYSPYDDYIEPEKVLKLLFLVDSNDAIEIILMDKKHNHYNSCVNYINECATIYRNLNATYCKDNYRENPQYNSLCEEIKTFNDTYEELSRMPQLDVKLPDLNSPIPEDTVPLSPFGREQTSPAAHFGFLSDPLKSKISTGIAVGAGTCGVLGFLYKFTPARSWFYGRNKGIKGNNFLDEGEINEMFHNNPNFGNMESDNSTYNIGYHNMEA